ncbi:galactose-specific lectin nattectin-like isoform X2 [Dicentrarchus labrax]|uniref:galactose-specific lectin nattectin-like isoform X2 n=1 Tax=Dicentrarchus labrax TaxID=13489 RepID=UPI0021F5939B|nr:galactose-specific lectin nattectin-like isoform X2 [Dicentrarchus labrax]
MLVPGSGRAGWQDGTSNCIKETTFSCSVPQTDTQKEEEKIILQQVIIFDICINFTMKMLAVSVLVVAMMALTHGVDAESGNGTDASKNGKHVVKRATCASGWSVCGGRCFRFFPTATTWSEAERACLALGANLASVHSRADNEWVWGLINNKPAWIGGSDAQQNNIWLWSDGTRVGYTNWCTGEPNNNQGRQHCLHINWDGKKCWDDVECFIRRGYICAKTP